MLAHRVQVVLVQRLLFYAKLGHIVGHLAVPGLVGNAKSRREE